MYYKKRLQNGKIRYYTCIYSNLPLSFVFSIRMIGSAALSMCLVACGKSDGYFEYGIHCWDIAAGDVIVREAGGVTMYPTGEKCKKPPLIFL